MRRALEATGTAIVAETSNQQSAARFVANRSVSVAVLEGRMIAKPDERLVHTCAAHAVSVVAVIGLLDSLDPVEVLKKGARGLVDAEGPPDELVQAVSATATNALYISPPFADAVVHALVTPHSWQPEAEQQALNVLTQRELAILHELTLGRSNAEVATHLRISKSTVKFHVSNILTKLGFRSRTQLVASVLRTNRSPEPVDLTETTSNRIY